MYNIKRLNEQKKYLFGIDDLAVATILAGVIGAGASIWNAKKQSETNETNLNYNEEMTREQWARDERAIQTQVQDAQKAGLSPLAVVNGGGATVSQAIPANAQSPNLDMTNMLSMFTSMAGLEEEKRHNKATEENESTRIKNEAKQAEEKLKTEIQIAGIQDETKRLEIEEATNRLRESLIAEAKVQQLNRDNQYKIEREKTAAQNVRNQIENFNKTYGIVIPTREYSIINNDWSEYNIHNTTVTKMLSQAIEDAELSPEESSESESWQAGGGINGEAKIVNTGGGGGINANVGSSHSRSANVRVINAQKLQANIENLIKRGLIFYVPIIK